MTSFIDRGWFAGAAIAGLMVFGASSAMANLLTDGTFDGSLSQTFSPGNADTFTAGTSASGVWYAHPRWYLSTSTSSGGNQYARHDNESDNRLFQTINAGANGLGAGDELSLSFNYILEGAFNGIDQRGVEILGQFDGDIITKFLGAGSAVEGVRLASMELANSTNTFTNQMISATLDQNYDFITVIYRFGAFSGDPQSFERGVDNVVLTKVPEPATLALFGLGLAGLGVAARRRKTH